MIDFYTWDTPNGRKVHIMLEECGLDYTAHGINIGAGAQHAPAFLKLSPNNRIPALTDGGLTLFESGAILFYLAEKTGRFFGPDRYITMQWLMFQMGGIGPMFGQANHFNNLDEKIPYALKRYTDESLRLIKVVEGALKDQDYLAGEYTIADMATWPWLNSAMNAGFITARSAPATFDYIDRIGGRDAVDKAIDASEELADRVRAEGA